MSELERLVFGREKVKEEVFGIYKQIMMAQTTDEEIMNVCQDGGVVTTLLIHALEEGIIDGAVLSGKDKRNPLNAIPKLATTKDEILECAGTRYTYSPNMLAFKEGVRKKLKNLAFVGTPCQIHAVRKIQLYSLRKYSKILSFTIGLFCSECFTYNGLVENLIKLTLQIDPSEVKSLNIKGKLLVTTKSGEIRKISLKEIKKYARNCVTNCSDFSSELADLSVGGLGLKNWTLTIVRSEKGEELINKANSEKLFKTQYVNNESKTLDLLIKMSRNKKLKAMNPNI
jgi:coenzyme F420 hydrogenase subunit beta